MTTRSVGSGRAWSCIVGSIMRWLCTLCVLLIVTCSSHGQALKSASCGQDGILQLVYDDGTTRQQSKEPLQVGCDSVVLAAGKDTVGWSVLVENCCTSYPIASSVVILSRGRKRVFAAEQMVWRWKFISSAQSFAMLSGPVHGNAAQATLYDIQSGRRLATWNGSGNPPLWAVEWKPDFGR